MSISAYERAERVVKLRNLGIDQKWSGAIQVQGGFPAIPCGEIRSDIRVLDDVAYVTPRHAVTFAMNTAEGWMVFVQYHKQREPRYVGAYDDFDDAALRMVKWEAADRAACGRRDA